MHLVRPLETGEELSSAEFSITSPELFQPISSIQPDPVADFVGYFRATVSVSLYRHAVLGEKQIIACLSEREVGAISSESPFGPGGKRSLGEGRRMSETR